MIEGLHSVGPGYAVLVILVNAVAITRLVNGKAKSGLILSLGPPVFALFRGVTSGGVIDGVLYVASAGVIWFCFGGFAFTMYGLGLVTARSNGGRAEATTSRQRQLPSPSVPSIEVLEFNPPNPVDLLDPGRVRIEPQAVDADDSDHTAKATERDQR